MSVEGPFYIDGGAQAFYTIEPGDPLPTKSSHKKLKPRDLLVHDNGDGESVFGTQWVTIVTYGGKS